MAIEAYTHGFYFRPARTLSPFVFHYYHDMESVYWILLFYHFTHLCDDTLDPDMSELKTLFSLYFDFTDDSTPYERSRGVFVYRKQDWVDILTGCTGRTPFAQCALTMHTLLHDAYKRLSDRTPEANSKQATRWRCDAFNGTHQECIELFERDLNQQDAGSTKAIHISQYNAKKKKL